MSNGGYDDGDDDNDENADDTSNEIYDKSNSGDGMNNCNITNYS